MPIYEKANDDVREILNRAMELYHGPLHEVNVRVDLLMASPTLNKNGDQTGPAVKHHGRACAATIKTVTYKDRVKGGGDLEIVIDKYWWDDHQDEQRLALLDHELNHRILKLDKDGMPKIDDLGRPKFERVDHDFEFGWFAVTSLRHGKNSVEVDQAKQMIGSKLWQTCIQKFLPGMEAIDVESEEQPLPNDTDEQANITTRDGRQITPTQLVDEITVSFTGEQAQADGKLAERIRRPRGASKR
jgi:hypothetical protein